jgi:hypothetical protein
MKGEKKKEKREEMKKKKSHFSTQLRIWNQGSDPLDYGIEEKKFSKREN